MFQGQFMKGVVHGFGLVSSLFSLHDTRVFEQISSKVTSNTVKSSHNKMLVNK